MLYTTIAGKLIEEIKRRNLEVDKNLTSQLERLQTTEGVIDNLNVNMLNKSLESSVNTNFLQLVESFIKDPANSTLTEVGAEGFVGISAEEANRLLDLDNDWVESSNNNSPPVENNNPLSFSVIGEKAKLALSSLKRSGELSDNVFQQALTLADKISQSKGAFTSVDDFKTEAGQLEDLSSQNAQELIKSMLFCNKLLDNRVDDRDISLLTDFEIYNNEVKQAVRPPPPSRQKNATDDRLDNYANPLTDEIRVRPESNSQEVLERAENPVKKLLAQTDLVLDEKIKELDAQIDIFNNDCAWEDCIDFNLNFKHEQFPKELSSLESKLTQQIAQETTADKERLRKMLANVNEIRDLIGVKQVDDEERLSEELSLFDDSEYDDSESLFDELEIHDDKENKTGLENVLLHDLVHIVESSGQDAESKTEFTKHLTKLNLNFDNDSK